MRLLILGAMPWALIAQAPPLTYTEIQQRAKTSPDQLRTEALLADGQRSLAGSAGFLREGPTLSLSAGNRTNPGAATSTDKGVDLDLPLFLSAGTRRRLEEALGKAHPTLRKAASIETNFRLRQAYLDAWLAEQLLALREADLATVQSWLKAAKARLEAGADPAFQVSLVEGEILKAQLETEEARRQRLMAWANLVALAEVSPQPVTLEEPGALAVLQEANLDSQFRRGSLRQAVVARLELEEQTIRHQEALSTSRWSLRGSYATEEPGVSVAKLGVAYRFSRPGEGKSIRQQTAASVQVVKRELEIALLDLDARYQAARQRLQALPSVTPSSTFETALQAVGLRLTEGKERPSEALPIRRQLLEARVAFLRRMHATQLTTAEVQALTEGIN